MFRIILFTLFVFCFFNISAQTDFREGFIITNQGDTVRGYLNYKESNRNFDFCEFRSSLSDRTTIYEPTDIKAYKFAGDKLLESSIINLPNQNSQWVFLEVIISGRLNLYKYKGEFFVKGDDNTLRHLQNEVREIVVNGTKRLQPSRKYIGMLIYLMRDCDLISQSQIEGTGLTERDLTVLVESYNQCGGLESVSYKENKPWFRAVPGVLAGVAVTSVDFKYFSYDFLNTFEPQVVATIGFDAELSSPRLHENVSFYTGAFISKNHFNSDTETNPYPGIINRHELMADFVQVRIPLLLRYTFPERSITPYLNLGFITAFMLKFDSYWILEEQRNNVIYTSEVDPFSLQRNNIGLMAGIGLKKRLNDSMLMRMEVRYQGIKKLHELGDLEKSQLTNLEFLLGIFF